MTTRRDFERSISAWLTAEVPDRAPEDLLEASRERLRHTRQRRAWLPAWRFDAMNGYAKFAIAAAAVLVVALIGYQFLPSNRAPVGAQPSSSPSSSPSPPPKPSASPVAYSLTPFKPVGVDGEDDPRAASVTFDFTAPPSWEVFGAGAVTTDGNGPPDGGEATVIFYRGFDLFSDPCRTVEEEVAPVADIPVGPTVDDLVTALVGHPSLDVTDPVDVTLAGYSGTYLDLTVPDDTSECANYRPMDVQHLYAQGPGQRWHMWILDVDGVRVLVETNDYAGTPPKVLEEEQAILDSLVITP